MKALINGTIYTPARKIPNGVVLIQDGKIHALGQANEIGIPSGAKVLDARGLAVTPGLIDLHTYGCLGTQLTKPERVREELDALARGVVRFGVTAFLISPPMGTPDEIAHMLAAIAEAMPHVHGGADCVGIHLEGPYLDPQMRGAFPAEVLRLPDLDEMTRWVTAARGFIRIVTLAPNLQNANHIADFLRVRGIHASVGHTLADYEHTRASLEPSGSFSLVTHVFNAMTPLHHRQPGAVGAALGSNVPTMLICDGEHVHPTVVKILLRVKTLGRVILVTDAIAGAGMGTGEFQLFGQHVTVRDGRAFLDNGTLAGSVLTLNQAVVNAARFAEIEFGDAIGMATTNPAQVLNLLSRGALRVGSVADLVVMNEMTGEVEMTIVGGEVAVGDQRSMTSNRRTAVRN